MTTLVSAIEQRVMNRLLTKRQAIRAELGGLKKSYTGGVSLRLVTLLTSHAAPAVPTGLPTM